MISVITAYIFLNSLRKPHHDFSNKQLHIPVAQPQEKTFKVQSMPFDLNGLRLQFEYVVKYDTNAENPKEMVFVIKKELVDLKRKVVVLDLSPADDNTNEPVKLADISKVKYSPNDFDDVNFDGYKDIMEFCATCGGATSDYHYVYLFNSRTKNFIPWTDIMGWDVEVNQQNRTTTSYSREGDGQFRYQEFKFDSNGAVLYEKTVSSYLFSEKKQTYKVVYDKYVAKKSVIHKTQILTIAEDTDPQTIIENITK